MQKIYFFLGLLYLTKCQLLVYILFNYSTDGNLVSTLIAALNKNFSDQEVTLMIKQISTDLSDYESTPDIIINLAGESLIWANSAESGPIVLSAQEPLKKIKNIVPWHYSMKEHAKAFEILASYLDWQKFIIISDEDHTQLIDEISSISYNRTFKVFYFPKNGTQELSNLFIGKYLKSTGIQNFVIINQDESAEKLIKSLKQKNLLKGVVLLNQNLRNIWKNGLFSYIESGLENADNEYEKEAFAIVKILSKILSYNDKSGDLNYLSTASFSNFTLINIQKDKQTNVGSIIDGKINITHSIIWPDESALIPNNPSTEIKISMADGITNPGFPNSPLTGKYIKNGALYALMYIKTTHFLDGFDISVTHTDCGANIYNASFSLNCFKNIKDRLGVGFLTNIFATVAVGNILSFRALNITIPHISDLVIAGTLTSKANFPEFIRISKDSRYIATIIVNFCMISDWKNIIVVYENSTGPVFAYNQILAKTTEAHINIVNSPNERTIKPNYLRSDYPTYKQWMENYIKSNVRIYIILMANEFYFIENMYDAGLRRGKGIFILYEKVAYSYPLESDEAERKKLKELLYGSIIITQADWVGDYGEQIKQGYLKVYSSPADYRCFSFDSAMLLLHGIRFTIDQGGNVENSTVLNYNLRHQRFLGCSGTVSIESDTNDRSTSIVGVYNIRWNSSSSIFYESWVGRYDLEKSQLFTLWDPIIYYDNSTIAPGDTVDYPECPFDLDKVQYSDIGAGVLYAISFGVLIISVIVTFYIWKLYWNIKIPDMTQRSLIFFEDYISMGIIVIDFLQFIGMGPDIKGYDDVSSVLADYATINYSWITRGTRFWICVKVILIVLFVWIFLSVHALINFQRFDKFFCDYCKNFSNLVLPIIGNTCFLPIISILLGVVQCVQGIGQDLNESFVRNDCSVFCWKGLHILWASLSIAALLIYIPMAVYFRPYWDSQSSTINVRARPWYMMLKSLWQIGIIVLNKTLKPENSALFGLIYIIFFSSFTIFCIKRKPYNYHRFNLWLSVSHFAVLWSLIVSSVFLVSGNHFTLFWIFLEYLGWTVIIILGVLVQNKFYPSLLYREKTLDISLFFRFSLGHNAMEKSLFLEMTRKRNLKSQKIDKLDIDVKNKEQK
ncbi:unnamed protein product [Blepharisma stoltei]|uniref:Receptor ligand binding region domain-containing protein n=1 Tax=Blepharisma stoltei TaxID=1481888 RepID=A0AAU9INM9_9CILI|nr:unnamed protein product [Blepharisma stoltei]